MLGHDLFQERAQRGDIPLAVTKRVQQPSLRLFARGLERFVEGAARGHNAQVLVRAPAAVRAQYRRSPAPAGRPYSNAENCLMSLMDHTLPQTGEQLCEFGHSLVEPQH